MSTGPRWDTGGAGGGGSGGSTSGGSSSGPDRGNVNRGGTRGGTIDTGGVADHVEPNDPDTEQNTSHPGGTDGFDGPDYVPSPRIPRAPDGGPDDPDVGTPWEDDDTAPAGSPENPFDPIDNPERFTATDNDENRIDMGDAQPGENFESGEYEAIVVDSDPSDGPGGGQTIITDGPDSGTSNDAAQQEAADELLDESADGGIGSGVVDPTNPEDVRDAIESGAGSAADQLTDYSDELSAIAAVVTIGSVGYSIWGRD